MGDPFSLGERDQTISGPIRFHPNDRRAEVLGEGEVARESIAILRLDSAGRFARRLDIHGVPPRSETARDSGAGPEHTGSLGGGTHTYHHALRNQRRLQAFALPVRGGLFADFVRDGSQRQLPQRRQVALSEEVGQRLLNLLGLVTLPCRNRLRSSSTVTSTFTTSSARSSTVSGTVSRTRTPVTRPTASLSVSKCWMFTAVITAIPLSNNSRTS